MKLPSRGDSSAPSNRGWVKWLFIGCGTLLVLAIAAGALFWMFVTRVTAGPEKVVKEFLAAAAAGDYPSAHAHFSAALKEEQPLEEFASSAKENAHYFDITHASFSNRSIDTAGAELSGTVTLKSGSKLPATFKLIEENEQWKLLGYHIGS